MLADSNRSSLPTPAPASDRPSADPELAKARALAEAGDRDAALVLLAQAQAANPYDPRIPFEVGELLFEAGRYEEAALHYRRTTELDASRAKVFFKLGLAYKECGERHRAVYALEQAIYRAGETSELRRRAEWEIFKLTFTIIPEAGFADGAEEGDTPLGSSREEFLVGDPRLAWWARVNPRFRSYIDSFVLRWKAPDGAVVQEEPVEKVSGPYIGSILELGGDHVPVEPGTWTTELLVKGDLIDRRSVPLVSR